MVFLELDRRGHYERSLCREDIDRTTAACRCGMTWGKENNAWIASFLNNSFKHSTSVCDTKNLALFSLFTSYLLTYHTVCLRGECLSVSFHLLPLSMPSLTHSITVYLQAVCTSGALKLPSLTLALLCMNIHLTGTCCSYYLPIISKSIRRKWHLMWE